MKNINGDSLWHPSTKIMFIDTFKFGNIFT